MKKTMILMALAFSLGAMADNVETTRFSTDVGVKFGKVKCTLFGNLKMKLTGLDSRAGWGAKKWLKAQDFDMKCRQAKGKIVDQVQRRNNSFPANVTVKTTTYYRNVIRGDRFGDDRYDPPFYYYMCEKTVTKKLTVVMTDLLVDAQPLILRNEKSRLIDYRYGPCPRN